jgi:hypothetical protein
LTSIACQLVTGNPNEVVEIDPDDGVFPEPTVTSTPSRPTPQPGPDSDGDWVSDADEAKYGSNPNAWDSDDDGVTDFVEIFIVGSEPSVFEQDSDEDGNRDVTEENLYGTDPKILDEDRDGDSIPDLMELQYGSDPGKADTDNDLLSDYLEIFLTETEPAQADPINGFGFPQPLEPWLPLQLQNVACLVEVNATIDLLDVVDAEEWDSPNDIIRGDEVTVLYGLFENALDFTDLDFDFDLNSNSRSWYRSVIEDQYSNFIPLNTVSLSCGESVTFAIQALEDDMPWGGVWNMGLWRHDVHLVFDNLPMDAQSGSYSMYFEGTTHDSEYEYDFDYTINIKLQTAS